jgi:FkbM family methyltransferase
MLKKIAKEIRGVGFINKTFRSLFKGVHSFSGRLISRWPVSGIMSLEFDNIPFKMYSACDDHIVHLLYYNEHYHEQKDLKLFLSLVTKSRVILDIGANTGIYSILSHKLNTGATIYSFEPYPVNITRLKKNLSINNVTVNIVEKALGDQPGKIDFAVPADGSIADTSSAEIEFSKSTYEGKIPWKIITVEQLTLDTFSTEAGITQVDLVKIDVEGHEVAVFKGGKDFFSRFNPVIQCEIILDDSKRDFFESFLKENNYTAYLILKDGLLRTDQQMIPNPGSLNYLFARQRSSAVFTPYDNLATFSDMLMKKNTASAI